MTLTKKNFQKRVQRTARAWVKLFTMANSRAPMMAELKAQKFEDPDWDNGREWKNMEERIQIGLRRRKDDA